MKASPSDAPGSVTLLITTTISITKSAGIATTENFSIPPPIPIVTITNVMSINNSVNIIDCVVLEMNCPKNCSLALSPTPHETPKISPKLATRYLIQ